MENQVQQKTPRQKPTIKERQKKIRYLEEQQKKRGLTGREKYELRRSEKALINQIKHLNRSEEEKAEARAKRMAIIEARDMDPNWRKRRLEKLSKCYNDMVRRNHAALLNNNETNEEPKKISTQPRKNLKVNTSNPTVDNPENATNNSINISSSNRSIEGYDSDTQSCDNSYCPTSYGEEDNHLSKFILGKSYLVPSTTSNQMQQQVTYKVASTYSLIQENIEERITSNIKRNFEIDNTTLRQTSQNEPSCKQLYKPKLSWLNRLAEHKQSINQNPPNKVGSLNTGLIPKKPTATSTNLSQNPLQTYESLMENNSLNPYQAFLAQQSIVQAKVAASCTNSQTYGNAYSEHCQSKAFKKFQQLLNPENQTWNQTNHMVIPHDSDINNAQSSDKMSKNDFNWTPQYS